MSERMSKERRDDLLTTVNICRSPYTPILSKGEAMECLTEIAACWDEIDRLRLLLREQEQLWQAKNRTLRDRLDHIESEQAACCYDHEKRLRQAQEMIAPMAEAAKNARPGPWAFAGGDVIQDGYEVLVAETFSVDDANHIAATNPERILALEAVLKGGKE